MPTEEYEVQYMVCLCMLDNRPAWATDEVMCAVKHFMLTNTGFQQVMHLLPHEVADEKFQALKKENEEIPPEVLTKEPDAASAALEEEEDAIKIPAELLEESEAATDAPEEIFAGSPELCAEKERVVVTERFNDDRADQSCGTRSNTPADATEPRCAAWEEWETAAAPGRGGAGGWPLTACWWVVFAVLPVVAAGEQVGNLTAEEFAFAAALGVAGETTHTVALGGPRSVWSPFAYAPIAGKLFAPPLHASSVLAMDPVSNAVDNIALGGFNRTVSGWSYFAYAPNTGKLYAAPEHEHSVLVLDPRSNATDTTTLNGLGAGCFKWRGLAFAPSTNKLYAAPLDATAVLIVDPEANTTDITALGGLGSPRVCSNFTFKWWGIAFAPNVNKLFASPNTAPAVLIVDPETNTTDMTVLMQPSWHTRELERHRLCPEYGQVVLCP
eukprot:m.37447 g.37447  ORF g.37447 m.37447 type:complete len:441 (+) comp13094_c0_seq1:42-1364(+)